MFRRLLGFFRRRSLDAQFQEEMRHHLDSLTEDYIRKGLSRQDAEYAARREFGGVPAARESYRDEGSFRELNEIAGDFRHAVRLICRNPVVTAVSVLTLALGIGANTAMFTLMDQVLFRGLPVPEPQQLVRVKAHGPLYGGDRGTFSVSYPLYRQIRENATVFDGVFGRQFLPANALIGGESERLWVELVSGNYFDVLGLRPHLGRLIQPGDDVTAGDHAVAVLGHSYWTSRLHSDPDVIGKIIRINGTGFTIIGVSPQAYEGLDLHASASVRIPMAMRAQLTPGSQPFFSLADRWVNVYGRLKPGVEIRQARAALQPLHRALLEEESKQSTFTNFDAGFRDRFLKGMLVIEPGTGDPSLRGEMRVTAVLLFGIVGTVLAVACFNIANILLARGTARRKEIAVRLAMGASRSRLVRQLLVESVLLAFLGGVIAVFIGQAVASYTITFAPPDLPAPLNPGLNLRSFLFTFVLAFLTGIGFGLGPGLLATRQDPAGALKDQSGSIAAPQSHTLFRKGLLVGQVALSLALVIVASLFVLTLRNLKFSQTGLREANLIVFTVDPRSNGYTLEASRTLQQRLLDGLRATAGVEAAATSKLRILGDSPWESSITIDPETEGRYATMNAISTEFFTTLGARVLQGREFTAADRGQTFRTAVVNESFMHRYLPRGDVIGRRIRFAGVPDSPVMEIVGVVKDVRYAWLRGPVEAQVYVPHLEDKLPRALTVYVRSAHSEDAVYASIRQQMRQLDPNLPIYSMRSMKVQIDTRLTIERMVATLATGFGVLATTLALVGLYGMMSYAVASRTREVGVRMALGADGGAIRRLILSEALRLVVAGAAIGLAIGAGASRALQSFLYGIEQNGLPTILAAIFLLLLVAIGAAYIPAWRASRVDPVLALRDQ